LAGCAATAPENPPASEAFGEPDRAANPPASEAFGEPDRAANPPVEVDIFSVQSDKLSIHQPIRIVNHWGNIELRSRKGGSLFEANVAVQRISAEPPAPPELHQRTVDGVAELIVEFPEAQHEPERTGRVDLAVFVPSGHPLFLEARDGLVKAKKTANPIRVFTDSGPIKIINDGPIYARSVSGRVEVRPMFAQWDRVDVDSEAGVVVAFLPTMASFELVVEGTDEVYSAFPLTRRAERYTANHSGARSGANQVLLKSGSAIEIHEAHLAETAIGSSAAPRAQNIP